MQNCPGLTLTLPAVAASVPVLRRAAAAFAARMGASGRQQAKVELAVSEAATNAVIHAYGRAGRPGEIDLSAHYEDDRLVVYVADRGSGIRTRSDTPGLGVGLTLMRRLTERLDVVTPDGPGTRLRMTFAL